MKPRFSLTGRLTLLAALLLVLTAAAGSVLSDQVTPWWAAWLISLAVAIPILVIGMHRIMRPTIALLRALTDGSESLRDNDFSVSIAQPRDAELGPLVAAYNRLGDALRSERQTLFQRELMLDTVIQTTDSALLLTNLNDQVVYSNAAARRLFNDGRPVNGYRIAALLDDMPEAFREAVSAQRDGLFTVESEEPRIYHLAQNTFTLNAQPHRLYLFRHMTRELGRQEVAIWKKLIRVISHELNNSLAPISSLAHSGAKLLEKEGGAAQLPAVFSTIEERSNHLKQFIESYSEFARLPAPRLRAVNVPDFFRQLGHVANFNLRDPVPAITCDMDPAQIEQVMINLIKNAAESGSSAEHITVSVERKSGGVCFTVTDKGGGITEEVMGHVLLPFYSTKASGTGLGLPLCREIVEGHGGSLSLSNIADEGLEVRVVLPWSASQ